MLRYMIRRFLLIVLLSSVMIIAVGGYVYGQEPYKIGAIFSVTGPTASLGIPEKNTADMLVEEINAAGGINGHKLEIVFYDTAGDETTTRSRTERLINVDKVSVIVGPSRSGTSLAIIDLMQNAQIPLISCAASVKIVEPVAERKWIFKTPQSDILTGERIAAHLKEQKITKVAIITTKDPFGASGKEQLEILLPKAGVEIVAKEEFNEKDTDVLSQLTKIKGADPQAVICWSTSQGGATVTKNMKLELKMDIPLIMSHGVANMDYIKLAGEAANGVIFPAGKLPVAGELPEDDPQRAVLVKYIKDYKDKFGEVPSTFGGHAWDAIQLAVQAMRKAGDDPAKIRDEIEKTKDFVGTGGVFNFSPTDHNGLTKDCLIMVKIVNEKWTLLK